MSESQFSCTFQESMHRGKYAHIALWVKYTLRKSSCVPKIPIGAKKTENNRFCVRIHFATNRFTFEKFPPPLLHTNNRDSVAKAARPNQSCMLPYR